MHYKFSQSWAYFLFLKTQADKSYNGRSLVVGKMNESTFTDHVHCKIIDHTYNSTDFIITNDFVNLLERYAVIF